MASASSLRISITLRCSSPSHNNERPFVGRPIPALTLRPQPSSRFVLTSARRRSKPNWAITSSQKKKQSLPSNDARKDANLDEDAFEALFRQLEEDLKNDDSSAFDGDDEISEEDLAMLERELAAALGDDELLEVLDSSFDEKSEVANEESKKHEEEEGEEEGEEEEEEEDDYDDDDEEEEDEEESPLKLKTWQLRRLAYALKSGRRKSNLFIVGLAKLPRCQGTCSSDTGFGQGYLIKNLAADLCLDRTVVLKILRDPPPNLLMLSAALPDKPVSTIVESEINSLETAPLVTAATSTAKAEAKVKVPVHVLQSSWSAKKRIKKVQFETLERVYSRTKRPTNAMISSIVHVTNLPRKRVVKWFEDKRADDGVPDQRLPFQRSTSEAASSS
ncbi:hypothetical protein RJ639_018748 [Escallonia herrerae]|uniref:Homeobox domain-containing protein n=1 Tax=Escallonia herrerae TaxID=1293975 RepID=A0AA89AGE5_9ASTE|nr:hypothetical protein RJ639_018748 [Escallonia herrerae]